MATFIQEQIKRQMAMTNTLVIGLDTDGAGRKALADVAEQMLGAEVKATTLRVATWQAHDVNDWLQTGGTAEEAVKLIQAAPSYIEHLLGLTDNGNDEAAVDEVFRVLAGLDMRGISRWRDKVCKTLDINRSEFDTWLKLARHETGLSDDGKPKYLVINHRTARRYYDRSGAEVMEVLANFAVTIESEIIEDDGSTQIRKFVICGMLPSGEKLPQVEVDAKDFSTMAWVLELWGVRALIEAGRSIKDHLRAAMQMLNPNVPTRYIYSHMGWRLLNQQHIYLSFGGAVGYDGIEVRPTPDLARYRLPQHPENPRAAMEASLRFWEVGD